MTNIDEIKNLFRAGYNLLYIVSHEEARVVQDITNLCKEMNMKVFTWTFTSGTTKKLDNSTSCNNPLKRESSHKEITDKSSANNPAQILDLIGSYEADAAFILKDYHAYMKEADIARSIKDNIEKLKANYTPIVFISPVMKIPIEIEKYVTVYEYKLPDKNEIAGLVNVIEEGLTDDIPKPTPEEKIAIVRACQGLTCQEVENVVTRSIIEFGKIDPAAVNNVKKQIIKKSGILEYYDADESMDNVGGMGNLKEWLSQRRSAYTDAAKKFGIRTPKGVILLGFPGCGKSLSCKAISRAWNMPLLRFDVGAVMQGLVGSSEENMRKVIQTAEASAPCVLWIDEIEKGLSGTGSSNFSDAGTTSRVFGTFITWLNEKKSEVFVVATANDVDQLPPELLRKGRFDEIFFVDLPDFDERREIFSIHLRKLGRDPSKFDLGVLAEKSEGFSGADIEEAINSSLFNVFVNDLGHSDISDINIVKALSDTVPLSKAVPEQVAKIRKWCINNRARSASVRME